MTDSDQIMFVGGPADGQWQVVEAARSEIRLDMPPLPAQLVGADPNAPLPRRQAVYERRVNFAVDEPAWLYDFVRYEPQP